MYKLLIFSICIIAFFPVSQGQSIQLELNSNFDSEIGFLPTFKYLGFQNKNYYYISNPYNLKEKTQNLLAFNSDNQLVVSKKLDLRFKNRNLYFGNEPVVTKTGTFLCNLIIKDGKSNFISFKFHEGQFETPKMIKESVYEKNRIGNAINVKKNNEDLIVSDDKSKVLYANYYFDRKDKLREEYVEIIVADESMSLLWSKKQNFGYRNLDMEVVHSSIGNDGKAYFIGKIKQGADKIVNGKKVKNSNKKSSKDFVKYEYKLFCITSETFYEYDINIGENEFPTKVMIYPSLSTTSDFEVVGFYVNAKSRNLNGFFYTQGKIKEGLKKSVLSPLKESSIKELSRYYTLNNYKFSLNNGNAYLIAEIDGIASSGANPNHTGTLAEERNTNDILILEINSDGKLVNILEIEKKFSANRTSTAYYRLEKNNTSFQIQESEDNICLLFNTNVFEGKKKKGIALELVQIPKSKELSFERFSIYKRFEEYSKETFKDTVFYPSLTTYNDGYFIIRGQNPKKEIFFSRFRLPL